MRQDHSPSGPSPPHDSQEDLGAVADNIAAIRTRIARASQRAGRDPQSVCLIAAAKGKSAAMIDAAIAAGVTDIGENYVQEAAAKRAAVHRTARWHMIGSLQRNKAARALEVFDDIQTVDNAALGAMLNRHGTARGRTISILVEVNIGGERSKRGATPGGLAELLVVLKELPCIRVEGLMTIPPPGAPDATRPFFRRLRELRDRHGLTELSMGMSDDFEVAVEEGATMIRIGRAIFGERRKSATD